MFTMANPIFPTKLGEVRITQSMADGLTEGWEVKLLHKYSESTQEHVYTVELQIPVKVLPETDHCKVHDRPRCKKSLGNTSDGRHCGAHASTSRQLCDFTEEA